MNNLKAQEMLHDVRQYFFRIGNDAAGNALHDAEIKIRKTLPKSERISR